MEDWSDFYNYKRPHSALKYLCPVDYYRGDPVARLADVFDNLKRAHLPEL
jgi:transposase InsO family protein